MDRASESLQPRLPANDDWNRPVVFSEVPVDLYHSHSFGFGLFSRGVRSVTFLPQEFERAQEGPRAHFPSDHVGPLVEQHRQVAIALYPLSEHMVHDGFAGRPNDQRLFELLAAPDSYQS